MTITENDFIEKMIEIAKTGYENMTQLQCVFFTWNEFFNTEEDACRAFEVASQIFSAAYPDEAPLDETNDFWGELACYLLKNLREASQNVPSLIMRNLFFQIFQYLFYINSDSI